LSDVIAKCQITSNPQSYILWTNEVDLEQEINNRLVDSINLYLGDAQSQQLNLGDLDWTCRLTIKEWGRRDEDRAINMGDNVLPALYQERQKAVEKLKRLREKISPGVDAPQG
jgi:hypothetical protein